MDAQVEGDKRDRVRSSGQGAGCPADFNGDGDANILHFIAFPGVFQAQDSTTDCSMDGVFNILDFICFQATFEAGCP